MQDIYGDIIKEKQALLAQSNGVASAPETRSVLHLSLCDTLQAYGCINDIAFTLTRNGVSFDYIRIPLNEIRAASTRTDMTMLLGSARRRTGRSNWQWKFRWLHSLSGALKLCRTIQSKVELKFVEAGFADSNETQNPCCGRRERHVEFANPPNS